MHRYIALLRGINVGGNHKVPMAELKQKFEELGFKNIETYINSGNVLFSGKKVTSKSIQASLEEHFGFPIPVIVLEKKVFCDIANVIPKTWQNDAKQKSDVLFLKPEFDEKSSIQALDPVLGIDTVKYVKGALLWNIQRTNQTKSRMQRGFIGSKLYKSMTARNVNTVRKLADLLED